MRCGREPQVSGHSMESTSEFGRWQIAFDRDETIRRYSLLPVGSGCSCTECKNFHLVGVDAYPKDFRDIADALGIDLCKPAELCHYGAPATPMRLTGGWFHVAGRITSGREPWKSKGPTSSVKIADFEKLQSGAEFGLSSDAQLVAEAFKGSPLTQVEFLVNVPWLLDD